MSTPNSEQIVAIEHDGGVLLQAGAGSGKTFVLKEHLIFISKKMIKTASIQGMEELEFSLFVRQKFRKIVLMTFTKKAAGELNIRLFEEFKRIKLEASENQKLWEILFSQLSYLNVSTIHGFCFKLIGMGFFPGVSNDQKILSDVEHRNMIGNLCEDFLSVNLSTTNESIKDLVLKEKLNIFDSLYSIFCDPTLRYAWSELKSKDLFKDLTITFKALFKEHSFDHIFKSSGSILSQGSFSGKKWFDFLEELSEKTNTFDYSLNSIIALGSYFEERSFKIPVRPRKGTVDKDISDYYDKVIALKDFFKSYYPDLLAFEKEKEQGEYINPWLEFILSMFSYVNEHYGKSSGLTFADMEYIVFKNLQLPHVRDLLKDEFDYFIIDEFQDTSTIQFSIVDKLVDSDLSRLFCVGDLKQAIYGFRGGELEVFRNCSKKINLNLSLKNNYRSAIDIIKFNNNFFDYLFKLGPGYTGVDPHAVDVEFQKAPENLSDHGLVQRLVLEAPVREEKYSNLDTNYLEALALVERIDELCQKKEESAVLYKKLKPSLILINLLMERGIGFSAQVKIPLLEDPIIGIFLILIEKDINISTSKDEYQYFLLSCYLKLIGIEILEKALKEELERFEYEAELFGLYSAFSQIIYRLGLRTSNYASHLNFIQNIIESVGTKRSTLYKVITAQKGTSHSLAFEFGERPELVTIMSAHGSKGLQFSHVFLAGIYTNDRSIGFSGLVGKLPFSLKWVDSIFGKKRFKTPNYLLEEVLSKNKEFSENKRLFYVACTRAENSLEWVHINWNENKRAISAKGSWHAAIHSAESIEALVDIKDRLIDIELSFNKNDTSRFENSPPLFHLDPLGSVVATKKQETYFLSELSVTRLATLAICPKKFYLSNICKISDEEISLLEPTETTSHTQDSLEELSSKNILASSSSRGTEIHEYLSRVVLSGFVELSPKFKAFDWLVDKLRSYQDKFELVSEKPIKFQLFGYMISGIPDLILKPREENESLEIWDYKTGKYSEDKLSGYYFQLMAYAYSQYTLKMISPEKLCKLVILFVDEKKVVEYSVSLLDVEKYFKIEFKKLSSLSEKNLDACEFCQFSAICDR